MVAQLTVADPTMGHNLMYKSGGSMVGTCKADRGDDFASAVVSSVKH